MKYLKETVKGNMTVEAALLMQIVLIIILVLVYTGFAVYNRNIAASQVSKIGNEVYIAYKYDFKNDSLLTGTPLRSLFWRNTNDFSKEEGSLEKMYLDAVKEKTIGNVKHSIDVSIQNRHVKVIAKCYMQIPFLPVRVFMGKILNNQEGLTYRLIEEAEYIRKEESNEK